METAEGNPSACQKKIDLKMIGLDWSGKTTILYKLKLGNVVETIPTIGYNVETFEHKNVEFSIWDIGGRHTIRPLWRHNFSDIQIQGLTFVVDSSDRARIEEAREELMTMLEMDDMKDAVLLILANKQDLPNAMSANEIVEKLGLNSLNNQKWYVQETSAITNSGLCEGLDWLCQHFGHC